MLTYRRVADVFWRFLSLCSIKVRSEKVNPEAIATIEDYVDKCNSGKVSEEGAKAYIECRKELRQNVLRHSEDVNNIVK